MIKLDALNALYYMLQDKSVERSMYTEIFSNGNVSINEGRCGSRFEPYIW